MNNNEFILELKDMLLNDNYEEGNEKKALDLVVDFRKNNFLKGFIEKEIGIQCDNQEEYNYIIEKMKEFDMIPYSKKYNEKFEIVMIGQIFGGFKHFLLTSKEDVRHIVSFNYFMELFKKYE